MRDTQFIAHLKDKKDAHDVIDEYADGGQILILAYRETGTDTAKRDFVSVGPLTVERAVYMATQFINWQTSDPGEEK